MALTGWDLVDLQATSSGRALVRRIIGPMREPSPGSHFVLLPVRTKVEWNLYLGKGY